jgi:hypothetical protein
MNTHNDIQSISDALERLKIEMATSERELHEKEASLFFQIHLVLWLVCEVHLELVLPRLLRRSYFSKQGNLL